MTEYAECSRDGCTDPLLKGHMFIVDSTEYCCKRCATKAENWNYE